jgi:ubiquinone/menaquinone biosynthesis C-methylase UbiE
MKILPGSSVLDIGTGTGVLLPFIRERVGAGMIYALDVAEKMLSKSRGKAHGDHIFYIQADARKVPFVSGSFETVVCYSAFPHFSNKNEALREIWRVLRKGGYLYIAHTSGRSAINEIHSRIPGMQDDLLPDVKEMEVMLAGSNFTNIKIEDKPGSYFVEAAKCIS